MSDTTKRIATLIADTRKDLGLTQAEFANRLQTSQSAVARIEAGKQNLSLDTIFKISDALGRDIISLSDGSANFRIKGGKQLSGSLQVNTSKNATVGLMCASLLNKGATTLKNAPQIEEVNRISEVLESIGVEVVWRGKDLVIRPPKKLDLANINRTAAKRTRSIIMFLAPLMHHIGDFTIPTPGGCDLGDRTILPHLYALEPFGLSVSQSGDDMHCSTTPQRPGEVILYEAGDTVTENAIMAAALTPGKTTIKYATGNYMVQDLCTYLMACGVKMDGFGSPTLTVEGLTEINKDIEFHVGEDPIEAMSFIAAAVVTNSELTIERAPIEFIEKELFLLEKMGLNFRIDSRYLAENGRMKLVNLTIQPSKLTAPAVKLHGMPYPGVNMDNLPFLALIAATASGRTLIHDWSFENRAIYFTELNKLGADYELADPHRVYVNGPTSWESADIGSPQALRPSMMVFLAMLAAPGTSVLRNVYSINRGYEDLATRLSAVGADISIF